MANAPKVLNVNYETTVEKENGGQGTSSATVLSAPKELSRSPESQVGENLTNVKGVATGNTEERSLKVSKDVKGGSYVVDTNKASDPGRVKRNVVNTVTVEDVKALIKKYGGSDGYSKEQIDEMLATIREGQYVKVDTTEYPTLEDFLASEGEQGTVYLYPVGNEENNYYQYIWEVSEWVSLGTTTLDLSQYYTKTESDEKFAIKENTVQKLLSLTSQRHLTSGEAKQCVGGIQVVSDYYLNLGSGVLLKNPYITGIQVTSTTIDITAMGLNTSSQTVLYKGRLTINTSDDTVTVSESNIITRILNDIATTDQTFNVINAADIVNNQLSEAQRTLVLNGKPTLIKGTYRTYDNLIILGVYDYSSVVYLATCFGSESLTVWSINKTNGGFGKEADNFGRTILSSIKTINGITYAQYYKKPQASVAIADGGTITDATLKALIQNEQPIKLNGYTGYFSCDDGTNYQYHSIMFDSANNVNHLNVITINKSTWVVTFHTSNFALN